MEAEPSPRWGQLSAPVEGKVYLYGGRTRDFLEEQNKLASTVHTFDGYLEQWEEVRAEGPPPPGLYRGACASAGHHLYVYGGEDGARFEGSLHQLDTRTSTWTQLAGPGGPMLKSRCGMVSHGEELVLFGGYGVPSDPTQPGAEFIKHGDNTGFTNELHKFDLKEGTWSSPAVRGTRPPPCDHFSFTKMDDHHAVLFGGYQKKRKRTNDVYIIDLTTMDWRKLDSQKRGPCPVGRNCHAAVCLGYGGDHPQLLVTGGKDNDLNVLSDAWILDLQSGKWREVKDPWVQLARSHHSATVFTQSPGLTEVTLFGGCPDWPKIRKPDDDVPQIANTTVLKFEHQPHPSSGGGLTGEWVLTDVAEGSQLGTSQRIRKKMSQTSTSVPAGREERVQAAERRATEAERREQAAERRATEAERREQAAERRAMEAERVLALIRRCLSLNEEDRPSASDITSELNP